MTTLGDDDATPPRGILVGSRERPTKHPRVAETLQRLERASSAIALGHAQAMALIASQVVAITADETERLSEAFQAPLMEWAGDARKRLVAQLERAEVELDELRKSLRTTAQYERLRQRHVALRRRLAPLADRYDEVREALAQDR